MRTLTSHRQRSRSPKRDGCAVLINQIFPSQQYTPFRLASVLILCRIGAEYKNRYKDVTICNCFVTFPDRKVTIEKQVALRYNKIIKILLPAGTAGMSKSFRPERIL